MSGPRVSSLLMLVCAACAGEPVGVEDELGQTGDSIVRGTAQPTVLALTARQKLAVGAVLNAWAGWANECTGTLIAPTLVATAAHCVEELRAGELAFAIGDDAAAPKQEHVASAVYRHPGYDPDGDARDDFAVLRFSSPFTGVEPIAASCDAVSGLTGKRLQTGGYGETLSDEDNSRRYWAAVTVQRVGAYDFTTNGFGSGGCYGDSGGPLLAAIGGEVRLIGTLSWGEQCGDVDHYTRVDSVCAFLKTVPGFGREGAGQSVEGVTFSEAQVTATLKLANSATEATLDGPVGLDVRAAKAIVQARPLATLTALAAVPYVGAAALTRLRDH